MQNYFPVTWPLAWRQERKGVSEGREGKRGKGVTWAGRMTRWITRWVQRSGVACWGWGGGCRVSTGFILGGRTTSVSWSAGGDPLRWPAGRHFVPSPESSGVSLRPLRACGAYTSALHDATSNLRAPTSCPANYLNANLPLCWLPRNDAHIHALSQTNKTDATDWEIPVDGGAEGHSDFYFSAPSLFVKLLWFWCEGRAYVWERYYQTKKKKKKRTRILSWVYGVHKVAVSTYQ